MLLARILKRLLTTGRVRIIDAHGSSHEIDTGTGTRVAIRLHDRALPPQLLLRPRLHVPEAYMDGRLTIEEGSLYDLIDVLMENLERLPRGLLSDLLNGSPGFFRWLHQFNPVPR